MLSILIPTYNEQDSVQDLHGQLTRILKTMGDPYEIVFVNDGSEDATEERLNDLAARDALVKVVHLRRNFGQASAIMAGIDLSVGETIVMLDADLQNDPADIPKLLAKLSEGHDVVSGWRQDRKEHGRRTFASRVANLLISRISGVRLHDYGCTLKAYRRNVLSTTRLYGEMHRFVPIYATWEGARVAEIPVNDRPRRHGKSNYGLERVFKVVLDLIVVQFMANYATKPIYVFGGFGLFSIFISFASGIWALYLKIWAGKDFVETPVPLLVIMAFITGIMSILMGLLAEMNMRVYYEAQGKASYMIKRTVNLEE
jgi:glycosyltransferase involved in cell wall biosynthesis